MQTVEAQLKRSQRGLRALSGAGRGRGDSGYILAKNLAVFYPCSENVDGAGSFFHIYFLWGKGMSMP